MSMVSRTPHGTDRKAACNLLQQRGLGGIGARRQRIELGTEGGIGFLDRRDDHRHARGVGGRFSISARESSIAFSLSAPARRTSPVFAMDFLRTCASVSRP